MNETSINTSGWNSLALTINRLLLENPEKGLLTIFITIIVFLLLTIITVWAITKIIKANKAIPIPVGKICNMERFTKNVLLVVEEMTRLQAEGRELSVKHTRFLEYTILRDQMILVDSSIGDIKNILSVSFLQSVKKHSSREMSKIMEYPAIGVFENSIKYSFDEISKILRRIAKENHLAEKEEIEFSKYLNKKTETLFNYFNQIFESSYSSNTFPFIFVEEIIQQKTDYIENEFKHILKSIRDISIHYNTIIKKEEESYQKRWKEFNSNILNILSEGIVE
jgi:hypothetical protein